MLGPVTMREAKVWVQTDIETDVRIRYKLSDNSENYTTNSIRTGQSNNFCATFTLLKVEPDRDYLYQVEINGQPSEEAYAFSTPQYYYDKTPPPDIKFALLGANYRPETGFEPPYQTLGAGYDIFYSIQKKNPDFIIWAGNTTHLRPSDWTSKSGYLKRYAHARSIPELKNLIAQVPNYATWGSADYGPPRSGSEYTFKEIARNNFLEYWPSPNPPQESGIVSRFRHSDVEFFILDVQSNRRDQPNSNNLPEILGKQQIDWLRKEIKTSTATFKCIVAGAPILNPAKNYQNLVFAEAEQKRMLQMLRDEQIDGLFFLSGGKKFGELTRLVHANSYNLYDLTVGPVTAAPASKADELNFFRMPGTSVFERHFAMIEITGPEDDRKLTMRVLDLEGNELWQQSVRASQLLSERKD